jgi:aspartyl-tRNA(Asn)/glutamyl-tRNA(Gln) amidotransferase subunit A
MGFTSAGLPLSLQFVGRPFDEATVLRAAHAYETATNWRGRRPSLDPAAAFSTAPPPTIRPEPVNDPAVRDIVLAACRRAELSLNDSQIDMICAAAPYVMEMTRRLRRERDFREEPANIFRFPE